jgi:hypothetical protein
MKLNIGDKVRIDALDAWELEHTIFIWGHGKVIEIDDDDIVIHWTTGRNSKHKLSKIPESIKIYYQYRREKKLKELGF